MNKVCAMIVLCGLAALPSAGQGLPELSVPDCLGVNIHFTSGQEQQVRQIANAGFRFIRMDFAWNRIEKQKGVYDFSDYDGLIADLTKHNVRALFILDYGNPLYDSDLAPHTDEGRAAFARFAAAGAAHFRGKGILWELWNEPNLGQFWRPEPNAENYVKLAQAVYPALKKADPDCLLLGPALSSWDFGFLENVFKLGLLDHIDVISMHPYGSATPEDARRYWSEVRSLLDRYAPEGREIPYLSGEWGYSAVAGFTVEKQGEYIARQFLVNMMNGARLSIWYDWHDDGPDPDENEHHFGTVYLDFTPKPAYFAAQTLMRELDGYSFVTRISGDSQDDYLALFRKGGDYRLAAWTVGPAHSVKLPMDAGRVEIVSLTGERSSQNVEDGLLELELSGAVQYVEPAAPSRRWAMEAAWSVSADTVAADEGAVARITSSFKAPHPGARIEASARGLEECKATMGAADTGSRMACEAGYVSSGAAEPVVTVTLHVEGLGRPLVRVVELNVSAYPTIEVLPPAGRELIVRVKRPVSVKGSYRGTLAIGNSEGLHFASESEDFSIPESADSTDVRLKLLQEPAGTFSFACNITLPSGDAVLRTPAHRYSVIEAFADGPVGEGVDRYNVELDGDSNVPAKAKLVYAAADAAAPGKTCARLSYEFDQGWRFVRVSPRPMIPISGSPIAARLWVRGDSKDGLARMRFLDSAGQTFQPDFGRISFSDWRVVEAKLTGSGAGHWGGKNDGVVRGPIRWDTLFLLDNAGGRKTEGSVCLGPMMLIYE